MKNKKILLISTLAVITALNLIGCSNEKDNLNQSITITDDVKSDTEPNLKVISSETIYLEETLSRKEYILTKKNDGSMMINTISGREIWSDINIENNKIAFEELDLQGYEDINFYRQFHSKKLDNNKILINDYYSNNQFEIDESIISNEDSTYYIKENFLIEYSNMNKTFDHRAENIIWTNLKEGNSGNIQVPNDIDSTYESVVVGDKLFISVISSKAVELATEFEVTLPDTLIIIDLTNNKIEDKIQIGSFTSFQIIDAERILFSFSNEEKSSIEIYNVNNKTTKEFMKYPKINNEYENSIHAMDIGIFPSKDTIYYSERDGNKIYVKVAEINGMDIENVLTVYEQNVSETEDISGGYITAEEREINIYNQNNEIDSIDKVINIKLNR